MLGADSDPLVSERKLSRDAISLYTESAGDTAAEALFQILENFVQDTGQSQAFQSYLENYKGQLIQQKTGTTEVEQAAHKSDKKERAMQLRAYQQFLKMQGQPKDNLTLENALPTILFNKLPQLFGKGT